MATYATIADFEAHVEGWDTQNPVALERILVRAERDVDRVLGPLRRRTDTGLKLDPATDLTTPQREALARAVAEQALWRINGGEGSTTSNAGRSQKRVKGPDFEVEYEAAAAAYSPDTPLAPGVERELEPLAWLRPTGARARV